MAESGNPNSVSDAGVGALCARAAVLGAFLNVRINAAGFDNATYVAAILQRGREVEQKTNDAEREILEIVRVKIDNAGK
jgi:glutamate formiminotransferase/formiminotetrahydrofolate cyclodeaminase